jgi:uncharacterized surface protein with fasciclin (FAS1) repeats
MKNLFFSLFFALISSFVFFACGEDTEPAEPQKNIVELAQSDANLSILVEAVVHADLATTLSGSTNFTVFAPTNAAFTAFLTSIGKTKITDVDKATVKALLLYHTVAGEVTSSAIQTGYVKSASPYGSTTSNLSLYIVKDANGVRINDGVKVTTADVDAANGVVHVVDKVIAIPNVVNQVLNNPDFSILKDALTRADLLVDYVGILSAAPGAANSAAPFTVFAPTNAAFAALLTELNQPNLNAIDAATLNKVLQYHVVTQANVVSSSLTDGQQVSTFQSGKITIDLDGGATLVDLNNRRAKIVTVDVQSSNGIIHAIDKVILPQL